MGVSLNLRRDALGHEIRIAECFPVANAHDPVALFGEPHVPLRVMQLSFWVIVPPAIDFDDKAGAMVNEVGDIATDWRLPADVEIQRAKGFPKGPFAGRHILP